VIRVGPRCPFRGISGRTAPEAIRPRFEAWADEVALVLSLGLPEEQLSGMLEAAALAIACGI